MPIPVAERAPVCKWEQVDCTSLDLKNFLVYRHVTAASLTQHVEQCRSYYEKVRP